MESRNIVKPLKLWHSVLLFMIPALFGIFAQYVLWPYLVQAGLSQENAYNSAYLLVFVGLLVAVFSALRLEALSLKWAPIKERLRLEPMTWKQWKWTLLFLFLYILLGYVLGSLAGMVYGYFQFWPPDADVPLTNIPFVLILLVFNIISEELWWRGYTLPSRATTWQVRLGGKWDPVVILPSVQMVGCPLLTLEAVDDSIHRAATRKHYPRFDHTLRVEWNRYLDHGPAIVDQIAQHSGRSAMTAASRCPRR